VRGRFGASDLEPLIVASRGMAVARGWNILWDMREAEPGDISGAQLFWLPRRNPALTDPAASRIRGACLYPPAFAAFARQWETSFRNIGLQARAFEDEAEAVAWLGYVFGAKP
jgi:hypothetical protein